MSDSENVPVAPPEEPTEGQGEGLTVEALTAEPEHNTASELLHELVDDDDLDIQPIMGECFITLQVAFPWVGDAASSVEEFLYDVIRHGTSSYIFNVRDTNSGEEWLVQNGQVMTQEDVERVLKAQGKTSGGSA